MRSCLGGLPGHRALRATFILSLSLLLLAGSVFSAPDAATDNKRDADRVGGLPYRGGEQPLHESYAGHITVRTWTPKGDASLADSGNAKIFYWYFPALTPKVESPPLVLWIQGGPGSSSMIGLFTEMGPLELTDAGEFYRRNVTWANEYDFLVVDQPVGTGFSSVTPKAKLSLDNLYPLASSLPEQEVAAWRAKYPKDVSEYKDIESPMTPEYAVSAARATLHELLMPGTQWPDHIRPFLDRLSDLLGSRQSETPGSLGLGGRQNRFVVSSEMDRFKEVLTPLVNDRDDPYLVNTGYGPSATGGKSSVQRSVWEKIGLSTDESGDFVDGYVSNMRAVGKDMWTFMQKFYGLRPELRERDFYIFSESYGGKFVPAIATYFDQKNQELGANDERFIRLKGMSIGNSWVHPPLQILAHGGIGYSWGLLDVNQADTVDLLAFKALNHTLSGDLELGTATRLLMFDYFKNVTGGVNWYDIRKRNHQYKRTYLDRGLNQDMVRKALHSEKIEYGKDWGVYYHLTADIMRTTAPLFSYLLERYPVQLNQGQFDFRDGVAGNTLWINELEWKRRHEFALADRQQWWLNKELAGYKRSGGGLSHWTILNAGHMSPGDQPEVCLDMVNHIVAQ
ncbi:hypothetical protein H4S04_001914 [Coemansia sp. S16]|nr:hypothetical protein GGI14_003579 [Coemansia sp. S680]KAJ2026431.1 hypothetical protein H4S03_008628 [Coemansia sp. S3946]KAJ2051534.1 hypothetical protein H4S04_001914 [Coemansia sp. S16]KAJ2066331.1 hypothetical protein GGI08_001929 [Coemansia sp. S2]